MRTVHTILILLTLMLMPVSAHAIVGEITEYTGDVYVLQDDTWTTVDVAPFSVVEGNRIMVRDGKATLAFNEWGTVQLNRYTLMGITAVKDKEGDPLEGTANLKLLLGVGQVKLASNGTAADAPLLKTPTATVYLRGGTALVSVGLDGLSSINLDGGASSSGRYGPYKGQQFTINPTEDNLTMKTLFEVYTLIGKSQKVQEFPVSDALVLSKNVIIKAWPDAEHSSLTPDLVKMQMEASLKEASISIAYIDDILSRRGPFLVDRIGNSLIDGPTLVSKDTDVTREYGTSNYSGLPSKGRGDMVTRLRGGLNVSMRQDDSVYDPVGAVRIDDTITTLSPWVLFGFYGDKHQVEVSYRTDLNSYGELKDEDYDTHTGWLGLSIGGEPGRGFFDLSDKNVKTEDYREDRLFKAEHSTNTVALEFGIAPSRDSMGYALGIDYFTLGYDDIADERLNRSMAEAALSVSFNVLPRTSMSIEAFYAASDYTDSADETVDADAAFIGGALGFSWRPDARMSGHIKVGAKEIEYDNVTDAFGSMHMNNSNGFVDMDIKFRLGSSGYISLGGFMDIEPVTYAGTALISPSTHYVRSGDSIAYHARYASGFGVKLGVNMESREYAQNDSSIANKRMDEVTRAKLELLYYHATWLKASVGYEMMEIESNDDTRDEEHGITSFSLTTEF